MMNQNQDTANTNFDKEEGSYESIRPYEHKRRHGTAGLYRRGRRENHGAQRYRPCPPSAAATGAYKGVLTDRDIITRCVAARIDPKQAKVQDLMTRGVISVSRTRT